MKNILEKGNAAPDQNFTGMVWVNMAVKPDQGFNSSIGSVTFEPQARTNWHMHQFGQILIVTRGTGYYQEKGKERQTIRQSDVVKIPVNVEYWHGASHDERMNHIAIVPTDQEGAVWLHAVTEDEYGAKL